MKTNATIKNNDKKNICIVSLQYKDSRVPMVRPFYIFVIHYKNVTQYSLYLVSSRR